MRFALGLFRQRRANDFCHLFVAQLRLAAAPRTYAAKRGQTFCGEK